jgi:hypothetical protein
MDGGPGLLGQQKARQDRQPQVPTERKQKPDPVVAGTSKRLASRFYQLKPHRTISPVDDQSPGREVLVVPIQHPDPRTPFQELPSVAMPAGNPLDSRLRRDQAAPGPTRGRNRTKIAQLLADEWRSQAVLIFFATTDVGRTSGPPVAEEGDGAASEVSGHGTRGAARIVKRGSGEAGGGGVGG